MMDRVRKGLGELIIEAFGRERERERERKRERDANVNANHT